MSDIEHSFVNPTILEAIDWAIWRASRQITEVATEVQVLRVRWHPRDRSDAFDDDVYFSADIEKLLLDVRGRGLDLLCWVVQFLRTQPLVG